MKRRFKSVVVCTGERLIQYATENLVTEVLIHPQVNTLLQCVRNLLSSFTRHRHLIHAGYSFAGNGSWILQVRRVAQKSLNLKNPLVLMGIFTFKLVDQFLERCHSAVNHALNAEQFL
jgi:hypothetical protein